MAIQPIGEIELITAAWIGSAKTVRSFTAPALVEVHEEEMIAASLRRGHP